MLNLFRKHATSWLIKVALILIAIVFIFWGGYSYQSREASRLAKVYDHYITYGEYQKAYEAMVENYRRQFANMYSEELLKQLKVKDQALQMLIERALLQHAAEELGLTASVEEIQQSILHYPVFLNEGKFEPQRYKAVLRQARMTPEVFEGQMATDLALQKVEALVKRQASVSDEEVYADYVLNNTLIQLAYVVFDPKDFEAQVKPEENEINTYYQEHQDKYQDPEKRQFSLVLFKTEQFVNQVSVSESDIQNYYEDNQKKYHTESQVKARHILFRVNPDAPAEEVEKVRAQAEEVLAQARKKGADFAELAKKYSQDPGSAQKGGDVGFFTRDKMVPQFAEAAFNLKPGEISGLVKTQFGFHIIKVEEVRPEKTVTLDEARKEIEATLKRDKARELAYRAAQDFSDLAYADKDLAKAAQSKNLQVLGSAWVAQKDPIAELGVAPKVNQSLFKLQKDEISQVLEGSDSYAVAQLLGIREPAAQPFDTVRDQVRKDLIGDRARQLAEQRSTEFLEAAKAKKNLETAATEQHLKANKTGEFSRKKPDDTLRLPSEALDQVFLLSEAEPFEAAPLNAGQTFVVCQLLSSKRPLAKDVGDQSGPIRERLLEQKQGAIWQAWMEGLRKQADVKILHEL